MNAPRTTVFVAGMFVVAAALVCTAHGMYVTALAAGQPWFIAWLYPAMFDFLALVGYGGAHWLRHGARVYSWCVVVVAALLSGLAQAVYLSSGGNAEFDPELAYWLGWWPPIGGLIAVHLLYLIWRVQPEPTTDHVDDATTEVDDEPDDVWAQFDDHGTNRAWETAPAITDPVGPQPAKPTVDVPTPGITVSMPEAGPVTNDEIVADIVQSLSDGQKPPTPWSVRQKYNVGPTRATNIITAAMRRLHELQESTP